MGLFGKKKDKVVDWNEGYNVRGKRTADSISRKNNSSDMGFLGNLANSGISSNSEVTWDSDSPSSSQSSNHTDSSEKRQKLTKRLLDMTDKIEDLSNQVYHLKQRVEVLEKKLKINFE
jgi:peptidoglycan hydrolase CwlO-like protein